MGCLTPLWERMEKTGHLAAGAGGGGDGDKQGPLLLYIDDALGAVHGTAAAQGNEHVVTVAGAEGRAAGRQLRRRVRRHLGKHRHRRPRHPAAHGLGQPRLGKIPVRDHQHRTALTASQLLQRAVAVKNPGFTMKRLQDFTAFLP